MFIRIYPRLLNNYVPLIKHGTRKYTAPEGSVEGNVENVIYPPILDLSYRAKKLREEDDWAAAIKKVSTVEEKLMKINMPRYYGWKSVLLEEDHILYNTLEHTQHVTKTHLIKQQDLPSNYYVTASSILDSIVHSVRNQIEDVIAFEYSSRLRHQELNSEILEDKAKMDDIIASAVVQAVNRTLVANLSTMFPHLLEAQVDFDPRLEAFWVVGGINRPTNQIKAREKMKHLKEYASDPTNVNFQYLGQPILQLRHELPLKQIISLSESENPDLHVPTFKLEPRTVGYFMKYRHATSIPGFWPGDECEFGLLSFHKRGYLCLRPAEWNDEFDALSVQAIFASYSWLLSQASYQGFSTYNDVTYPFTSQMVITNGQWWSFYVYQLNTTLQYAIHSDQNPRRNICWATEPEKLFDKVENEKVCGFNDEVLKRLIKLYINVPDDKLKDDMKPYLGKSEKVIADIEDPERRQWLEKHFKHLMSCRPRHKPIREIYDWQRIYLINHKTRPFERKLEPFQHGINVLHRRLDDHLPRYIPRYLRKDPKKRKIGRWEKTYYP